MKKFVVCIDNSDYEASLEKRKIYEVIEDKKAQKHGMIRIIDESGEDYLHSEKRFILIKLEKPIQKQLFKVA